MKNHAFLILVIALAFVSCEKNFTKMDYDVSTEDAKKLITNWIINVYNPEMNPSFSFSLVEITTDEIFRKSKGQVFSLVSDVPGLRDRWVFIKNNSVYDLHPGNQYASETDFNNLLVTDLNNDSEYELSYTSHSGSGILYQRINCFYFKNDALSQINSDLICRFPLDYQIYLEKESYRNLYIKYKDDKNDLRIGEVKFLKLNGGLELIIELKEDISQEIRNNLNGV